MLDIKEIMNIIPQRPPFLMIDRVEEYVPGESCTAYKTVCINEPHFEGHFPGNPIMPRVLIVEALAQTGCVLLLSKEENKGKIAFFAGINKARFRKQVIPGDVLTMTVTLTKEKGGIYFASIQAKVEDEIAVTGEIMCAVGE